LKFSRPKALNVLTGVPFVPAHEVEAGHLFLSGAGDVFIIRFYHDSRRKMLPRRKAHYFSW